MGCGYSTQRSQSNGKSDFQNDLTNQKFDSNSKLNWTYRQHHDMKPIRPLHFPEVLQNANQFWCLKRSHQYGILICCHHGIGRTKHWNHVVTCNVTVAIVKMIVIVSHLPYQITKKSHGSTLLTNSKDDTDRILWSFKRNFLCHVI